jgi:deoxyribonuclease V
MTLWSKNISRAREIQDVLRRKVQIVSQKRKIQCIAAVDAAFHDDKIIAIASLYEYPELRHIKDTFSVKKIQFPYITGLLSFREGPALIDALKKLLIKPDLILFDGQGIAHPKGIGIASHIGVILKIRTIGCAKSRLIGDYVEPDVRKGSWSYLYHKAVKVGVVLRTRNNVKPVFVSPGHMIDIHSSRKIVMRCISAYRIPEPLRRADCLSKRLKDKEQRKLFFLSQIKP